VAGLFPANDPPVAVIDQPVFLHFLLSELQASADSERGSATVPPINLGRPVVHGQLSAGLASLASLPAGRKPAIYLYPPSCLPDVIVQLLLTSSWSFSAIYPLPQTAILSGENKIPAQSLTWAIEAEPDGTLVEKTTGVEVSYLYWEAM
jgi:hypothetical protein